jgi:hypothetical protein
MERNGVLTSVAGAITCAAAGKPCSPAFSEAATLPLLVVSRHNGQKWRRTKAAGDEIGETV